MTSARVNTVAIVDDEADIRSALRQLLDLEQFSTVEFADAESALAAIDSAFPGVVISDLRMPGIGGGALFDRLFRCDPELPVIMMSGHGDIATAVDLVKRGAYDFLTKPFEGNTLIASIRRALDKRALVIENRRLRDQPASRATGAFLGETPAIEQLRQTVTQLAQADIDVFIDGESGSGKSLIATTLHNRGPQARKTMITVDCNALPVDHADSLLFGHASGAFASAQLPRTGQLQLADGGTLFLDHVDGLPRLLQLRIKQALERRSFMPVGADQPRRASFRTITATSADPDAIVDGGAFDRSLYHRLAGYRLSVPPLRDRRDDVFVLFRAFLAEAAAELNRDPPSLSPAIWRRLQDHHWPGNVRELRNFAANVVCGLGEPLATRSASTDQGDLKTAVAAFEADVIRAALDRHSGDIGSVLAALKLPRKTLYDKMVRHVIDPNDYRPGRARRS